MGTSNWQNISWCVQAIMKIEPSRVVDIGVGFGRWGMTLREFAEVWFNRVLPAQWEIDIEGIEAFEGSIVDYHHQFYNRIHIGDALEVLPKLEGGWSLAILGDVLEHFFKSDGEKLLAHLIDNADYVLVNLPLGEDWPQEDMYDNPYEEHKAVWEIEDFDPELVVAKQTFSDFEERPFASFVLSRNDPRDLRTGLFGSPKQGETGRSQHDPNRVRADLDFGDANMVASLRERVQALESIRASGAWRAVNQARNNPLVWKLGKTLRQTPGDGYRLENVDGKPLRLLRVTSDGSPVLWDFLRQRGGWSVEREKQAAFGEMLVSRDVGDSIEWFGYGAEIALGLLGATDAGRCRLTIGKHQVELDLSRNRITPLVFDASEGKLFDENVSVPLVADVSTANESTALSEEERVLCERVQADPRKMLAVYPPRWTGIRNSTQSIFSVHAPLPEKLTTGSRDRFLNLIDESGCESLVLSGGALDHLHLARELNDRSPKTKIRVLWHGNYMQASEDYAWRGMRLMTDLARRGQVHALGFVKEGMSELMEQQGLRSGFVLNYIDAIPEAPSKHADGGPHFGMWISNEGWRKMPYAMAAGAARVPGANLHFNGERKRLVEFSRIIGLKTQAHGEGLFDASELAKWMRLMHLNLYVTLSECCPMVPLESLSLGAPCLIGPTSHLFRDDRYLFDRLVVPFPDSSESIYEKTMQALEERDEIVEAYRAYAPGYNLRAKKSVEGFLDL